MIDEGVAAPSFELPALVDGTHRRVALEEYLGEDVIILAFYPGDFNPACDEESDLDELDLFTMQKDVTVLGIGPDTLYAHEAFADAYDLHVPLLSDTRREVADLYDVAFEDDAGQDLVERAVFVVDHDGEIAYAWSTRDMEELPATETIKDAIGETGGDGTAFARYRVGHAHYVEGRRAFTSAMGSYGESEWMLAQSDFQRAREEFTEADEHFDSAVRFVDDDLFKQHYATAEEKATLLWQAADWLAQSASNYSSGRGAEGQQLRDDAERPLEEARTIAEPIDPDAWPPEGPPETSEPEETDTFVPDTDEDRPAAALEVDIDEESAAEDEPTSAVAEPDPGEGEDGDDIDDEELAEIEAELAGASGDEPAEDPPDERRSVIDHAPGEDDNPNEGAPGDADEEITEDDLAELGAEIAASNPVDGDLADADAGGVDVGDDGETDDAGRQTEDGEDAEDTDDAEDADDGSGPDDADEADGGRAADATGQNDENGTV